MFSRFIRSSSLLSGVVTKRIVQLPTSRLVATSQKASHYSRNAIFAATTAVGGFALFSLYNIQKGYAEDNEAQPKTPFMDCGDPACHDKQEMFMKGIEAASKKSVKQPNAYTQKESEFTVRDENGKIHECPPTRELLGRHSWTLLHSIAAYYPDNPTEEDKKYALEFIESFAHLYPCKVCREHLQKILSKNPPNVNSRKEFMLYLCAIHNSVNRTLLKPIYPCNFEVLEERWHTGCPECWNEKGKKKMTSQDSMDCKDMRKFGVK